MKAPELIQLNMTAEILKLIGEIDEFKGRWSATQLLAPERLAALRKVATIESVGSSTRIEGVKLTNSQVEELLRGVKNYSFRSRDEQEVAGYAEVMELIYNSYQEMSFDENLIKYLHQVLLRFSAKDERHRGEYKKFSNNVEAFGSDGKSKGIIFHTATPFETPSLMKELVAWINSQFEKKTVHPLLAIAIFVLVFLHIHPFQDGNGRLSRVLTTLLLLKLGYTYVPFSSFERVIEENKESYYLALRKGQSDLEKKVTKQNKGIVHWFTFFLKSMLKQKFYLEEKLQYELAAIKLSPLSREIIEIIKSRGSSNISEIVSITGANRNTVKAHLKKLVEEQKINSEGLGRGVRYRLN